MLELCFDREVLRIDRCAVQTLKKEELEVKQKSMAMRKAAPRHETGVLSMMNFDEVEDVEMRAIARY